MFEGIGNGAKKEAQAEVAAEKRQMDYGREQTVMGGATHPSDDQTYMLQQQEKADLLRWQQDLGDELNKLILTLKGQQLVNDKVIKLGEPLCNDKFINEVIIPQCSPFLNRNIINTNYSEQSILDSLKYTMGDIDNAMADHYDVYDIAYTNFDLVHRNIVNVIKPGIYRALQGWTKKMDSTMSKRIEAFNETQQQQPQKKWGLFGS